MNAMVIEKISKENAYEYGTQKYPSNVEGEIAHISLQFNELNEIMGCLSSGELKKKLQHITNIIELKKTEEKFNYVVN